MTRRVGAAVLSALLFSTIVVVGPSDTALAAKPQAPLTKDNLRTDLPRVLDGEVLAVHEAGGRAYVGGDFTTVEIDGIAQSIPYFFALDLDTGNLLDGFAHDVGGEVRAIELSPDGADLYLGGTFKNVNGVTRRRIAKLDALTGAVDTAFTSNASAAVDDLALSNGTLYAGGRFTKVNGITRSRLAAVDAATGEVDPGFDFVFSEPVGGSGTGKSVRALDVSPDGTRLLVVHLNRFIDDQLRTGVAMIDISGPTATLAPWSTALYDTHRCVLGGVWVRDGKFAPDGSYFVVVGSGHDYPPVCDSVVRFANDDTPDATYEWTSRHMDTIESVAVDDTTIYVGGHFKFQESPAAPEPWPGTSATPSGGIYPAEAGAFGGQVVKRFQLGAIDPATGHALPWDIDTNAHRGVLALEVSARGLLIGMDAPRTGSEPKIGRVPVGVFGVLDRGPIISDTTPPTVTSLTVLGGERNVRLSWLAADNDQLHGVRVYRDGTHIGSTHETSFVDTDASGTHVYEVRAYDRSGNSGWSNGTVAGPGSVPAENAALGATATQSSVDYGGEPARAVDGDTDGVYDNTSVTHTASESQPWFEVDLGSVRHIDRVVLWNRTDCCDSRLRDLSLFVSDTPFTSNGYWSTRNKPHVTAFDLDNILPTSFEIPTAMTGRYLRVQRKTNTGILSLAEVQVFAQPIVQVDGALLVVGDADVLNAGDTAIRDRILGAGVVLDIVEPGELTTINPASYRFVWVSTTASATAVQAAALHDTTAPVVISKPFLLDDLGLTGPVAQVDYGSISATAIDIVDDAHALAAGLTGTVTMVDVSRKLTWGVPGAEATTVATLNGASALFAYETGDLLADATTAPGCRVAFPAGKLGPANHTTDAWAIFDAVLAYVDDAGCDAT